MKKNKQKGFNHSNPAKEYHDMFIKKEDINNDNNNDQQSLINIVSIVNVILLNSNIFKIISKT